MFLYNFNFLMWVSDYQKYMDTHIQKNIKQKIKPESVPLFVFVCVQLKIKSWDGKGEEKGELAVVVGG